MFCHAVVRIVPIIHDSDDGIKCIKDDSREISKSEYNQVIPQSHTEDQTTAP